MIDFPVGRFNGLVHEQICDFEIFSPSLKEEGTL
jgi:hypothetical protein